MKIIMVLGSISLGYDGDKLWLVQPCGEAMEVSREAIEELLQDYYVNNY